VQLAPRLLLACLLLLLPPCAPCPQLKPRQQQAREHHVKRKHAAAAHGLHDDVVQ
jgi:hypothetical protein